MGFVYQWIAPAEHVQIKKKGNKMKKILLATVIALVTAVPVMAACEGGTEVKGFCISNIGLNWWSAVNWCKANGRHLATMYEICPDWDGKVSSWRCRLIDSSIAGSAWTATVRDADFSFIFFPRSGAVSIGGRREAIRALCK